MIAWAISYLFVQSWACGTHPPKLHRGHLTSAWQSHSSRCIQSCKHSWLSSPRQGDVGKPLQDIMFILIVPSLAIGCEWVFCLTAMWVHPCQAHLPTLADATWKLMLLADEGPNWPYAYVQMNDTVAHVPLSSEGHIGILTDGIPRMNTSSHLDQLQMWRLLQCRTWVVCIEGLNGGLKALPLDFEELPLWNMATADEPTWDLSLIEVDLNGTEHLPPEQEIHSAWRGWNNPSMIWWPPLCRCHCMQSHQKTSLASSKSVIHHPHLQFWEVWRWPASPPLHWQMRCFNCKGRWMWPWSGCSWLRPPWTPIRETCHWMPILPGEKMRPGLLRSSKRQKSTVQLWSRRWRPIWWSIPASWKNPTMKAC